MLLVSTGALLLLLPWVGSLVTAEVVDDFKEFCKDFFYKATPPTFQIQEQHIHICQIYNSSYRFATLYDRQRLSPFYSAYKTSMCTDKLERSDEWMYEPQLAGEEEKAMQPLLLNPPQAVKDSQAVLEDYRGSIYEQGHLNPNQHHGTQDDRDATFTLTNVVPQWGGSNRKWAEWETKVRDRFKKFCNGVAYVITGVIPYENVGELKNARVSVPEYLWSAYCCPAFKSELNPDQNIIPTYAAVVRNDPHSTEEIVPIDNTVKPIEYLGYDVREMSLIKLQDILKQRLNIHELTLFDNNCTD
ncbi:endonuclease domain-containing 1 protein-like [Parambassis ranga]|uniref:Endonuclease domain-containing 1 protein-like n=1 Tax=Parambassis ranga TaxID=210632 RepID=A0A6P7J6Z9_9TELE|nr:endonuclease domain-containing 1 protein-like [Parambassis ranga]